MDEEDLTPPIEQETQNHGCGGGMLHYRGTKKNREVWALEVHMMASEAEWYAARHAEFAEWCKRQGR